MTKQQALDVLINHPAEFGKLIGFTKLTDLHNSWIRSMITSTEDQTLQAHRGSYKTTCVSIALAIIIITKPTTHTMFMRKTDDDVKEIIEQVKKILQHPVTLYFVSNIWGVQLKLTKETATEINTNLYMDVKGTPQLVAIGMGSSVTGKHFDVIFTDDIVNLKDRSSKAERDRTKASYQELQNIKNRGGRIFNTGTPWHKEDAFVLMPKPEVYDCYHTGLMSEEEIESIKASMLPSLFCANYELRHIQSDDVIFFAPVTDAEPSLVEQGLCHIDSAYSGEDYTAFTIMRKANGKYYCFGKMWRKHVDDCLSEIIGYREQFNAGKIWTETNADKGYLAKDLKRKGERVATYHENMNKFIKITTYLKSIWNDIVFVKGTDAEYINQICDYTEDAEHDDAPDSCSCLARILSKKSDANADGYTSIFL